MFWPKCAHFLALKIVRVPQIHTQWLLPEYLFAWLEQIATWIIFVCKWFSKSSAQPAFWQRLNPIKDDEILNLESYIWYRENRFWQKCFLSGFKILKYTELSTAVWGGFIWPSCSETPVCKRFILPRRRLVLKWDSTSKSFRVENETMCQSMSQVNHETLILYSISDHFDALILFRRITVR